MKKGILITLIFCCVTMASKYPLSATTVSDAIAQKYAVSKDICPVVKSCIKEGLGTQEIVKTSLLMGHKPCYVIKCAADGGGTLEQIIYGAIEAAVTADIISRCCLDAGFGADDIAKILQLEGLSGEPSQVETDSTLPGGGRVLLSPSSFK